MRRGKKAKPKSKPEFNFKVNGQIRANEVRLVGDENPYFTPGTVYPIKKAREIAEKAGVDLVLISPKANPPVCKVVDLNKFKYELKRKQKEIEAKQVKVETKEIRLTPTIAEGDIEFKLVHAKNFLKKGNVVRLNMFFKGRMIVHKDLGKKKVLEFAQALQEYGVAEGMPKLQGKRMLMDIKPKAKKKAN